MSVSGDFCFAPVLESLHRERISGNMSGTQLQLCDVSTTPDLATKCWPLIDEWSSEVTLALERLLTKVSTVAEILPCFFLVHSHCTSFVEWILPCFCFAQGGSLVNFACVCT